MATKKAPKEKSLHDMSIQELTERGLDKLNLSQIYAEDGAQSTASGLAAEASIAFKMAAELKTKLIEKGIRKSDQKPKTARK